MNGCGEDRRYVSKEEGMGVGAANHFEAVSGTLGSSGRLFASAQTRRRVADESRALTFLEACLLLPRTGTVSRTIR